MAKSSAIKHLPRVLFAQDVVFKSDSTNEKTARLFEKAKFINGEYEHERRTPRIIVQEHLHPLKTLTNVKNIARVLLDAVCDLILGYHTHAGSVHWWLYEHAGILHRDLSPNNVMYQVVEEKNKARVMEEKVCGVLTDFDLASWTKDMAKDCVGMSQQGTGMPLYMAHGLFNGSDDRRLYRHDLESLLHCGGPGHTP